MSFTIYSYPDNKRVQPSLIAAALAGLKVEVPPFTMGTDNKTPSFLAISPTGRVPAMTTPAGTPVFESAAMSRCIARSAPAAGLLGATAVDEAGVDAWMSVVEADFIPAVKAMIAPHMYEAVKYEAAAAAKAKAGLDAALAALERVLATKTYLVGERVTLADIWVIVVLTVFLTHVLDAPARDGMPNTMRYHTTLSAQPAFAKVIGEITLCETPLGPVKKSK